MNRHAIGGPLQDHAPLRLRVRGRVDGQEDARPGSEGRQPRAIDEARLVEGLGAESAEAFDQALVPVARAAPGAEEQ